MSSWNRNNPRFRRTRPKNAARKPKPPRSRSHKNLLSRFGARIGGLLRGLTGQAADAPETAPANRPQPAPAEDPFEELKIAVPKNRKYSKVCAARSKPRPEAETEAGRRKAVAEVLEAITASPDPEDLAAECEDLVDPHELMETVVEPDEPALPLAAPDAAPPESASVPAVAAPVSDDSAPAGLLPAEADEAAGRPETPPSAPEPGRIETLPKIAVLDRSASKAASAGSRRRPPSQAVQADSADGRERTAPRRRRPESAGKAVAAENADAPDQSPDSGPAVPLQAVSESEHIKNDGKKPTDWSRLAGRSQPEAPRRSRRVFGLIAALVLVGAGLGLAFMYFTGPRTPMAKVARIPAANLPKIEPLAPGFYELWAREREATVRSETTITSGSSLSKALEDVGVGARQGAAIIESLTGEGGLKVGQVQPGSVVKSYWTDRGRTELDRLEFHPASGVAPLVVRSKPDGGFMRYSLATLPLTVSMAREGTITSSLWEAGDKAGLDYSVIMSITEILASEVDFFTDIKTGDSFQLLYNRDYSDGRPQGAPTIEKVKLVNKGRVLEYYRFENKDGQVGYFDRDYRSSVKTFFVTPLQYKRISSQFSMARKHPIFKKVRPHQGVDYAAPTGTPVSSVADGTVIFCGWSGGYGKLVTIKHDETYTTMYAHLSDWAPGLKKGSVVKQGDLIGKVGATGTATGPHLDFRLKKNNVFIDPIPELAKQQGKKLDDKADQQRFATEVGRIDERMRQQMAGGSGGDR